MDTVLTPHLRRLAPLAVLALLVAVAWFTPRAPSGASDGARAANMRIALEAEFDSLAALPGARSGRRSSSHKASQAYVGASYHEPRSFEELRQHYVQEFGRRGWRLRSEQSVRDTFRDLGGKRLRFCKEEFLASVQYAGDGAAYSWTYTVSLTWGLYSCSQ